MFTARNKNTSKITPRVRSFQLGELPARRGYTVIEILIVIVIMTLIFGVGTASYRSFQRRKELEGAANKVKADLRLAQEMAMSGVGKDECASGLTMDGVVFKTSTSEYTINISCTDGTNTSESPVVSRNLGPNYPNISLSGGPVVFNILGRGVESNVTLNLEHDETLDTRDITITTGGEINITD